MVVREFASIVVHASGVEQLRCARVVQESAEHGTLYHIKDATQMKKAFADRNIARERAQWLFNYDPLRVPLQDEELPL